jgi:putative ABC transport system ATP-binding protein
MPDNAHRPLIEIQGLTKTYSVGKGVVEALKNVSLKIYRGDSLAIMGPSGSGKSTLLHLLGCLDLPTSGNYFLDQENISHLSDDDLAKIRASKIGFVFQSFNLIPQLNILENVAVPFLYQRKAAPNHLNERLVQALSKVGLSHRLYHHPSELSGGEMQRVAIARALATNPLLILADEPTGNLDSENGKAILKLFTELNSEGVTVVIITHDPNVAKYCKRLIRMRDGHIVEDHSCH